jgi:MFS family permease
MRYSRSFVLGVTNGVLFKLAEALVGGTTVLPAFMSNLTSSKVVVGLAGTMSLAGWFLPQLVVANLVSHLRAKKPVYVWAGVVRIAAIWTIALMVVFVAGAEPAGFLAAFLVLYSIYVLGAGVAGIPFMDMVAKAVPAHRRGTFFGARLFIGGIASALAGLFVKEVLSAGGFPGGYAVLFLTASAVVTAAVVSFCLVRGHPGR